MTPPKIVGLVFHPGKPANKTIHGILRWLAKKARLLLPEDHPLSAKHLRLLKASIIGSVQAGVIIPDLVLSFGGDGTILHAIHGLPFSTKTRFLGLNYGNLGFLTEGGLSEGLSLLERLWKGDFWIDKRRLLHFEVWRDGQPVFSGDALNEVVVRQGRMMRPLRAEIFVDKVSMASLVADGFIVATPTGSTAYALSAGGPILHPYLKCFELTPIAPHSMNSRTIVVHDRGAIRLVLESLYHQARVYADGIEVGDLETADEVVVKTSRRHLMFVRVKKHHHYSTLRQKLGWND